MKAVLRAQALVRTIDVSPQGLPCLSVHLPTPTPMNGFDSRRLHSPALQGVAASRGTLQNGGYFIGLCLGVRLATSPGAFRLRRILRRLLFRFGWCLFFGTVTGNRPLKVGVGHVNVMPHRNGLCVAQPLRHNRQRELSGQIGFATRPHRMP